MYLMRRRMDSFFVAMDDAYLTYAIILDPPSGLRVRLPAPIDLVYTPSGGLLRLGKFGPKDVKRLAWHVAHQLIDHGRGAQVHKGRSETRGRSSCENNHGTRSGTGAVV